MSALTKFVNIANKVRPPSLMVYFLLLRRNNVNADNTPPPPQWQMFFIPFPSLGPNQVRQLKISNFDILLIENRKFANVSNTIGKWLLFILDLI